jgi:tetratricopeptide (TPR) repeat protein
VKPKRFKVKVIHSRQRTSNLFTAALLLAWYPAISFAQVAPTSTSAQAPKQSAASQNTSANASDASQGDRRRAARLFLEASKLFEKQQFEEALDKYEKAKALDPTNRDYGLAAELDRSHAVTALIQQATQDRVRGDLIAERAALEHALTLDPRNVQVTEHLHELGEDSQQNQPAGLYAKAADGFGSTLRVEPTPGTHSFHLHVNRRQTIQQVFKAYGIDPAIDDSVPATIVRFDVDDVTFEQAARTVGMVTNSFYVPLDAHRAVIAKDSPDNRRQFERQDVETVYLPGLTTVEFSEVSSMARNIFDMQHAIVDPSAGTISIRAPSSTLNAFNATIHDLIDGHNQVLLEVSLIQLAHTSDRNTGIHPPQSISAFNVYSEEQSILNANQSLVQQIISSGLAAPGDTLAILGILIASGQVSSSLFSSGIALFGGGITQSALSPGTASANLNLNSSDSKELDHMLLRLSDGVSAGSDSAAGTIRSGTRYPIQTSSFSSLSPSVASIPGLTGAGTSSNLTSLLGSLGGSLPNIPQVEYQDLGLTLKATPRVLRNNDVALTVDMKIDALSGGTINGNPILNSRSYSGVTTLKQGEGVVIVSELDKQESSAISGVPGLSEVPGLNNITGIDNQKSKSTLLIVMTPHVVRGTQAAGHSPMLRIERNIAQR